MALFRDWQYIKSRLLDIISDSRKLNISPTLVSLLIVAEDHRFGHHPGVDPISLCRAFWRTLICRKKEGGSTIAMQLVRVITGHYEKTFRRKIEEIYFAMRITNHVCVHDIPKLYLTIGYFGWRMNGLKQASMRLKLDSSYVSLPDAAVVIARLKYPEPRCPTKERLSKIANRARYIIARYDQLFKNCNNFGYSMSRSNGSL